MKERYNYKANFVIISAGVDKLVPPLSHLEFFKDSPSEDKDIWYYDNAWHAIYQEEEIHEILERLKVWIDNRIH